MNENTTHGFVLPDLGFGRKSKNLTLPDMYRQDIERG